MRRRRTNRNAFRHGLSLPVRRFTALSQQAEAIAVAIAGTHDDDCSMFFARTAGEASMDINRIRAAKRAVLERFHSRMRDGDEQLKARAEELAAYFPQAIRKDGFFDVELLARVVNNQPVEDDPVSYESLALELARLDQYERRAWSRKMKAVRVLP